MENEIIELLWQHTPTAIKAIQTKAQILECLAIEAETIINYTTSDKLALKNYNWCKMPQSHPNDFKFRWLSLKDNQKILTSIRYEGGIKSRPFIEIVLKNFPISNKQQLNQIAKSVKNAYSIFKPQRFRFFNPEFFTVQTIQDLDLKEDLLFMVGLIDQLKNRKQIDKSQPVELKKTTKVSWYNWYKCQYEFLFNQQPFLKRLIHLESEDSLQKLADKGLCFELYVQKKLAGVIAFDQQQDFFLKGYAVIEELIGKEFRGKGLAKCFQQQSMLKLPYDSNFPLLWGYIGFKNVASQKTAMGIGRQPMGGYYFYNIT